MLSKESLPYIIDALGSTSAGNELIAAFTTPATLSADTYTRLQDAFGEADIAAHFQAGLLGTYQIQLKDAQFIKCAFAAPLSVLTSILNNMAGGVASNVNPNYL